MERYIKPVTPPDNEYVGVSFGPTHVPIGIGGGKVKYSATPLTVTFPETGLWFHQFANAFGTKKTTTQGVAAPPWLIGGSTAQMGWDCAWDYSPGSPVFTDHQRYKGDGLSTFDRNVHASNFNFNKWYGGGVTEFFFCLRQGPHCTHLLSEVLAANVSVPVSYQELFIMHLERAKCGAKQHVQNEWGIAVKNGVYHVVVGTGEGMATVKTKPEGIYRAARNWNRGCAVENTRFVNAPADYTPNEYAVTVEVTDGRLSLMGTSSGGRLLFCQAIKYLKIKRVGDALRGPWAPISRTTKGAWWQMELDALTPVGLVSVTPVTSSAFTKVTIADEAVYNVDCRNWWLYKGRGCPEGGIAGPQSNPIGRFKNGGIETGAIISISNQSCVDEVCDPAGQHMCGSDEGTPGKSSFDRAPFSRPGHNLMFPQFSWCDRKIGKYVRVWLPGKDRIFEANVFVNRDQPVSPQKLAGANSSKEDDTVVCYGVEAQVHTDSSTPEYIISEDPEDPIFYSTCYVRERSVGFKPIGNQTLVKGAFAGGGNETMIYNSNVGTAGKTWKVNGACMSCGSYASNLGTKLDDSQAPPRWVISGENACRSCEANTDLLLRECNATAGLIKAASIPCFTASSSVCSASVSVLDSTTCTKAITVATSRAVNVTAVDSTLYPTGCSFQLIKGVMAGYFNTPNGNATSCRGAVDKTFTGKYDTAIKTSIAAKILPEESAVVLTLRGQADGWFAFAFAAKRMGDLPHTLVVESAMDNVKLSEWRLGSHARGTQLSKEAFAELGKGKQYWLEAGCTNQTQSGGVAGAWGQGDEAIGHVQCCSDSQGTDCSRETQGSTTQEKCGASFDHDETPCAHDGVNAFMKQSKEERCDGPGEFELTVHQCAKAAKWIDTVRRTLVSPISPKNPLGGRQYGDAFPKGCQHIFSRNTAKGDRSVRYVSSTGFVLATWQICLTLDMWPC